MSSVLSSALSLPKIREFYVFNAETLFKKSKKPLWVTQLLLILEYYNYIAISLNSSVISSFEKNGFPMGEQLGYISWANISSSAILSHLVYAQIAFHGSYFLTVLGYYFYYCAKGTKFMSNILFGFIIQTFSIQILPGMYFSCVLGGVPGYSNAVLCVIMGSFSFIHTHNNYYTAEDVSQRNQNLGDALRLCIGGFLVVLLSIIERKSLYFVPLFWALSGIGQFLVEMPFFNDRLCRLSISLNVTLLGFSILVIIHIIKQEQKWLIQGLLCIFSLCFIVGHRIYSWKVNTIYQNLLSNSLTANRRETNNQDEDNFHFRKRGNNGENIKSKISLITSTSDAIKLSSIEFISRNMIFQIKLNQNKSSRSSTNNSGSSFLGQIETQNLQETLSSEQYSSADFILKQSQVEYFLSKQDIKNQDHLHEYISRLYEGFFAKKQLIQLNDYGYLFYLLEERQNFPKLLVRVAEFKQRTKGKLGIKEEAALNYIMHQSQCLMNKQESNGKVDEQSNQQKLKKNRNILDLCTIFINEQKICELTEMILECSITKIEILKCIGQDIIKLKSLRTLVLDFSILKAKIKRELKYTLLACDVTVDLEFLSKYFCSNLEQDKLGFQESMRQVSRLAGLEMKNNHMNTNNTNKNANNLDFLKHNLSSFVSNLRARKEDDETCGIFISLLKENLGSVNLVSNQCKRVLGYTREEMVNKNISLIMPQFIGEKHNQILRNFINQGVLSKQSIQVFEQMIFAIRKDGFCQPIELTTQIHVDMVSGQAGMIGMIRQSFGQQQSEDILVVNCQFEEMGVFLIDCCSEKVFNEVFSSFCDSIHGINQTQVDDFLPILSQLISSKCNSKNLEKTIGQIDMTTIGFFPKQQQKQALPQVKQQLLVKEIREMNVKSSRKFNLNQNNMYVMNLKVKLLQNTNDHRKMIKMGVIQFLEYQLIENEEEQKQLLETILLPQLQELFGFDKEPSQIIEFLDQNYLKKMGEQIDLIKDSNEAGARQVLKVIRNGGNYTKKDSFNTIKEEAKMMTIIPENNNNPLISQVPISLSKTEKNSNDKVVTVFNSPTFISSEGNELLSSFRKSVNKVSSQDPPNTLTHFSQEKIPTLCEFNQKSPKKSSRFSNALMEHQQQERFEQENQASMGEYQTNNFQEKMVYPSGKNISNKKQQNLLGFRPVGNFHSTAQDLQEDHLNLFGQPTTGRELLSMEVENFHSEEQNTTRMRTLGNNLNLQKIDNITQKSKIKNNNTKIHLSSSTRSSQLNNGKAEKQPDAAQQLQQQQQQQQQNSSTTDSINTKNYLISKIKRNHFNPVALQQFQLISSLFFLSSVIFVTVQQINLLDYFHQQNKAFTYITWVMNMRNLANQISGKVVTNYLTYYPDLQAILDSLNTSFRASLLHEASTLAGQFNQKLSKVTQEYNPEKTVVLDQILSQQFDFRMYNDYTHYVNYTTNVVSSLFFLYEIQWERIEYGYWLPVYNYDQNFPLLSTVLTKIQVMQQDQVDSLYATIYSLVKLSLAIIAVISAISLIDVVIVFRCVQDSVEKVLKLFATFDSLQIQCMTDIAQEQFKMFFRNIAYLQINLKISGNQESAIYPWQSSSSSSSSSQKLKKYHYKQYLNLPRIICQKKKIKVSSTTSLEKSNLRLIFISLIAFGILIVQPIANIIFTGQQIDSSKMDSNLIGQIETARSYVVSGNVLTYFYVDKMFNQARNPYPATYYVAPIARVYPLNSTSFSNLIQAVENLRESNSLEQAESSYERFFFTSMVTNTCQPYKQYPEYYMDSFFSQEDCSSIMNGIFNNGFITAVQIYMEIFLDLKAGIKMSDSSVRLTRIKDHFQRYSLYSIERVFQAIQNLFLIYKNFIVEKHKQFFDEIINIQMILMGYEIAMICLVSVFFFMSFYHAMKKQLNQAIMILSVFDIEEIYRNSYIHHFIHQI